jgi:hypothetical protein
VREPTPLEVVVQRGYERLSAAERAEVLDVRAVAAAEREACAELAERLGAPEVAGAIRARAEGSPNSRMGRGRKDW